MPANLITRYKGTFSLGWMHSTPIKDFREIPLLLYHATCMQHPEGFHRDLPFLIPVDSELIQACLSVCPFCFLVFNAIFCNFWDIFIKFGHWLVLDQGQMLLKMQRFGSDPFFTWKVVAWIPVPVPCGTGYIMGDPLYCF